MTPRALNLDDLGSADVFRSRFWANVRKAGPDECWLWTGETGKKGHGRFALRGKTVSAHRISWALERGPVPDGLCVCHDCPGGDNPACVNPSHLWLGTKIDNNRDRVLKGRSASGLRNGRYTHPESTPRGERHCHAKLNNWSACGVLARLLMGVNQSQVAREFGVTGKPVRRILAGTAWKHVFGDTAT